MNYGQVRFFLLKGRFTIRKSSNLKHYIHRIKHKNHTIISIDAEKAHDKIQYPSIIKKVRKLEIESNFFNILKVTYEKSTANIVNGEGFPSNTRRIRTSTLTTSTECCTVGSS